MASFKPAQLHSEREPTIDKKLSWLPHMINITNKANQTLNFLKRNLSNCSAQVKASTYLTLVCPQMEYAAAVWDPYYQTDIQRLEKVQ